MSFNANDDLLKHLIALGAADAAGRILAGALVDPNQVAAGAVQSTEYTLSTCSLPANALAVGTRALLIVGGFVTAGNANAKEFKVYLGATSICTIGTSANAKVGSFALLVLRTAASTQIALILQAQVDGALVATPLQSFPTAAITESAAIDVTLKAANTAAAASAGTGKGLAVIQLG